jgi:predicted Fe-Mo cluster-binding NifX family protein
MKAAVALKSNKKTSEIALRFARGAFFSLIDKETGSVEIIPNPYSELDIGAGTLLIQFLKEEHDIDTLIAYELGLKVQQLADKEEMRLIIISEKNKTLSQLFKLMKLK